MPESNITFETFVELYQPIENHLNEYSPYDNFMFGTFDQEFEFVRNSDPQHVWTLLGVGGGFVIASGLWFINRLGYFVTKKTWPHRYLDVVFED